MLSKISPQGGWDRWASWNCDRDAAGYEFRTDRLLRANRLRAVGCHCEADQIIEQLKKTDRCREAVTWQ